VALNNKKDVVVRLIFKDGSREKELKREQLHGLHEMEVTNMINDEEDREQFMVEQVLRKYHSVLKYLFMKYSNTSPRR
jgi:hypothetical protein